ncbi:MAG: STAS domain-containing protein [Planctomycetota bacterium]
MNSNERHVSTRLHEGALVIEVNCRQLNDHDTLAEMREEILVAMQNIQAVHVILDLRNVELLTSAALFPFIEIREVAEREARHIVICNVATPVAHVLTVSQLIVEGRSHARHLVLTDDIPAALAWLGEVDAATPVAGRPKDSLVYSV